MWFLSFCGVSEGASGSLRLAGRDGASGFKPFEDGSLVEPRCGVVFEGERHSPGRPVPVDRSNRTVGDVGNLADAPCFGVQVQLSRPLRLACLHLLLFHGTISTGKGEGVWLNVGCT